MPETGSDWPLLPPPPEREKERTKQKVVQEMGRSSPFLSYPLSFLFRVGAPCRDSYSSLFSFPDPTFFRSVSNGPTPPRGRGGGEQRRGVSLFPCRARPDTSFPRASLFPGVLLSRLSLRINRHDRRDILPSGAHLFRPLFSRLKRITQQQWRNCLPGHSSSLDMQGPCHLPAQRTRHGQIRPSASAQKMPSRSTC